MGTEGMIEQNIVEETTEKRSDENKSSVADSKKYTDSIAKKIAVYDKKNKQSFAQQNIRAWCKAGSTPPVQGGNLGSNPKARIQLIEVKTESERFQFNQIIKTYHTYRPSTDFVGKRVDYIIKVNDEFAGIIGFSNPIICIKDRDNFIGFTNEAQRLKGLNRMISNWRYCVHTKGYSSQILSLALKQVVKDWEIKFKVRPVLIETLIEAPYKGSCYLATGFVKVGETAGTKFVTISKDEFDYCRRNKMSAVKRTGKDGAVCYLRTLANQGSKKIILVKPLHKLWKKTLLSQSDSGTEKVEKTNVTSSPPLRKGLPN